MLNNFDNEDETLRELIEASKRGDLKTVKQIIKYGKIFPEDFDIVLLEAARNGHLTIVKLLLKYNKSNNSEALLFATTNNRLEVVKYLLKNHFYPELYEFSFFNRVKNPEIFTLLIKRYIERYPNDLDGLRYWAKDNKNEIVLELLKNKTRLEKLSKIA
jgi:ankyrin repeat protein